MSTLRTKCTVSVLLALGLLPLGTVGAAPGTASSQASIAFAHRGGIRDWVADRDKGLWVQDAHRNWFYASLLGPCSGLDFAQSIRFDTRPADQFDRWSSVIVPGWGRCQVSSLTASVGPPRKHKAAARSASTT